MLMHNTALAFKGEYDDEVPVSSVEVVEANVAALRDGLNEVKKDVIAGYLSTPKVQQARNASN